MSGTNDANRQSAIERFNDIYRNQPAANKTDGYYKVPNRTYTPPAPAPPPKPQKIRETAYSREQRYGQGFASGRPLRDHPGFRNPIAADQMNLPTSGSGQSNGGNLPRQPINRTGTALDFGVGLTQVVAPGVIQQGPNYLNPQNPKGIFSRNEYLEDRARTAELLKTPLAPGFRRTNVPGKTIPDPLDPSFWNPLNPISPFNRRSPFNPWQQRRPGDKFFPDDVKPEDLDLKEMGVPPTMQPPTLRAPNSTGNPTQNSNLPDWLDPIKDTTKSGDQVPEGQGPPNAESTRWYPSPNAITVYSPNNRTYLTLFVLSYSVEELPKRNQGTPENPIMSARFGGNTYLREGKDSYLLRWTFFQSLNPPTVSMGDAVVEPWTLQNLGPAPGQTTPNPDAPELIVPETQQPFFPPLPNYLDALSQPYPPTILDPNDFRSPQTRALVPAFPPDLSPLPKPLDPIQKPEPPIEPGLQPPKPREDEVTPDPRLFPFNPLQPSAAPNPIQNPPPFEPGPINPNQRLNDRGIFPAQKATITSSASGSPLSPDVEIGGDPLSLKPAPKLTKPTAPFETEKELQERKKREEDEKKSSSPIPLPPIIPPVFPKPIDPTGTIDPKTSDDITKNKNPPPPPAGTKPKCQDGCMAGLQSGQESILSKLNGGGGGLNVGLNAAELGLLTTINNKVGDQVPGGLSGKLTRLSSWLQLDRALNLMTYANTLHNAYMLSSGLTQTLFGMVSNVLAAVGIKDAENNPFDVGTVLGKAVDDYAKGVLGVTTVDGIKAEWKKFSRIYQAAANVLFSLQSIGQSILGVLEIVGSNVAKIGNALTKWGAISEKAYGKMNDTPNFQNRFFTRLETVEQTTSQIDSIASEVLSTQDSFTQIKLQQTELENAMKQDEGSTQGKESPEAAALKAAELAKKATSQPPTIPVTAETKPEA